MFFYYSRCGDPKALHDLTPTSSLLPRHPPEQLATLKMDSSTAVALVMLSRPAAAATT